LKTEDETDKDKAHKYMYMIEHTKLEEIVETIEICFDPDDLNTLIEEDKITMEQYREFENMMDECTGQENTNNQTNEKQRQRITPIE
jgi:hypothetical protein